MIVGIDGSKKSLRDSSGNKVRMEVRRMNSYEGEQLGRFIHEDRLREGEEERLAKKAILGKERERTNKRRFVKNLLLFFI